MKEKEMNAKNNLWSTATDLMLMLGVNETIDQLAMEVYTGRSPSLMTQTTRVYILLTVC